MKTTFLINNINYRIPNRMVPAIERYINDHIRPENFLQAVICNDLKEAVFHANPENLLNFPAFIYFFHWEVPSGCHGSKEKMEKWITQNGG